MKIDNVVPRIFDEEEEFELGLAVARLLEAVYQQCRRSDRPRTFADLSDKDKFAFRYIWDAARQFNKEAA